LKLDNILNTDIKVAIVILLSPKPCAYVDEAKILSFSAI